MLSTPNMFVPGALGQSTQRSSFASRISGVFGRQTARASTQQTPRDTTTFEVPLFLSPSRYEPAAGSRRDIPGSNRSSLSPRALFGAIIPGANATRCPSPPSPSQYSEQEETYSVETGVLHPPAAASSELSSEVSQSTQFIKRKPRRQPVRHKKRRPSIRQRIRTLKQLTLAFGITFLLAAVTYLVLAATGIASGVMFHVITILLILFLFGVFLHSTFRFIILRRRRKERRTRTRAREQWWGQGISNQNNDDGDGDGNGDVESGAADTQPPEKPIQIIMKEDEITHGVMLPLSTKIKHPPPTYGNFRGSKKIDPSLVHWQKVPPSPLTPSYAEAMTEVQRAVGYRPPSYIESDNGATQVMERRRNSMNETLYNLHPLKRPDINYTVEGYI